MEHMERLPATDILQGVRNGSLTVEKLCSALLDRVKSRSEVRAWVHLDQEQVLREARRLDAMPKDQRGPLFGLPVAVKDLFYTKDMPTRFGSPRYSNHHCDVDASIVSLLRQAGCLIMGKTVTTEFAMTMNGKDTANPHNLRHTPAGSSSGSAAAVADYQAPIALGTQTYGSVVRPASFCGIYGYKPTYEVVSLDGCKGCCKSLDTIGFFARSVADLQLLQSPLRITDIETSSFQGLQGAKIAWCKTPIWPKASAEAVQALEQAVALLSGQGAACEELVLGSQYDKAQPWHAIIGTKELATTLYAETSRSKEDMDAMLVKFIETGEQTSLQQYKEALDGYAQLKIDFDARASAYDAVLTLSAPGEAPEGLGWTGDSSFCVIWTTLGVPIINLPGFGGPRSMPIGLSLLTSRWRDVHLLAVAQQVAKVFESEGNWHSQL